LRDAQSRRLPEFNAAEFATYVLFYPALTAGPIDRLQRFVKDLRDPQTGVHEDMIAGTQRIVLGVFKKFALADTLALFALNAQNAAQISSPLWSWVLLYTYSLRIFFDFAGYTDIAIGIGRIAGVQLPENFQAPYLKTNLTTFWNTWHITLAQWFRAYFFNPLTRALRASPSRPPVWVVILIGQVSTMLLIGLWHGITWNFTIWGLWHGIGLFAHNRWSDFVRSHWGNRFEQHPQRRLLTLCGWFLTFHFVTLGWVWFALPNLELALSVYARLLGI
jgi:D-alanyl-lipoteichoic acid acyltransferase DltB (MBOAT superfamily)